MCTHAEGTERYVTQKKLIKNSKLKSPETYQWKQQIHCLTNFWPRNKRCSLLQGDVHYFPGGQYSHCDLCLAFLLVVTYELANRALALVVSCKLRPYPLHSQFHLLSGQFPVSFTTEIDFRPDKFSVI